jgi:predicted Fe-Mo cluster-binding NifX family protein
MTLAEPVLMKVAMAHWRGRVSPVFDVADHLFLLTVEGSREVDRENLRLASRGPFERVKELSELGVEVLLCGAISLTLEKALIGAGIRVVGFLGGELEGVICAFLEGCLNDGRVRHTGRLENPPAPGSTRMRKPAPREPGLRRCSER